MRYSAPEDPSFGAFPFSSRYALRHDAGRPARRVRLLGGTSDWRRDLIERAGATAIGVFGTQHLRTTTPWYWPTLTPQNLGNQLAQALPGIAIIAVARPRQVDRARLSLLCVLGSDDVVVKLGRVGDGIENETAALRLLTDDPLPGIATPTVIESGLIDDDEPLAFHVTSSLGLDRQRPAIDEPLRTFESDLGSRLGSLPKPSAWRTGWVPSHGDLTPWNLRRTPYGLALFDWEAAGWRPAGSDLAQYRRTSAELARWGPVLR